MTVKALYATAALAALALAGAARGAEMTFFCCSDTHYGTPASNNLSQAAAIDQMNALPGKAYPASVGGGVVDQPVGVMVLGDLIDNGSMSGINTQQWALWEADFGLHGEGRVAFPVYEGFGNHDLGTTRMVQKRIIARNLLRAGLTAVSTNGLHYSMDWGGVHVLQLGLFPGNVWSGENSPTLSTVHNPEYARDFLVSDLRQNVGRRGRPVIVTHHYDVNDTWWTEGAKCKYYNAIRDYNVICVVYGHTGTGIGKWRGLDTVNDGNLAGQGTFVFHVTTNSQLIVAQRDRTDAWNRTLRKNIFVPDLEQAWQPAPASGNEVVAPGLTQLAWRMGDHALTQSVYFGTDSNAVRAAATPDVAGIGAGVSNAAIPAARLPLLPGTEYFWRVDQERAGGLVATGTVWRFRTRDVPATNDVTFLFVSDTHFGTATLDATRQTVLAMNAIGGAAYPADFGGGTVQTPRGVLHGGDTTDHSYDWEWAIWTNDYGVAGEGVLSYPAYEIYGNHDGSLGSPVGDGIVLRNRARPGLTAVSSNGLHYSWTWDNVHFVSLGVRPGDYINPYNPQGSLAFLARDLATFVGNSGRPVVLYQHFGYDSYGAGWWTEAERERMYDTIKDYNVIGIFHGHTHSCTIYKWNGIDIFNAPHMDFGALTEGFFVAHVTSNRFSVAERKADGTWSTRLSKPIYLSYSESGLPAVLNNGQGATNVTAGAATLTGELVYESPAGAPTKATICWGLTDGGTNFGSWARATPVGTVTTGAFSVSVGGLSANRTYYYRTFGTNDLGAAWASSSARFTTDPSASVSNGAGATAVSRTGATLNGELTRTGSVATWVRAYWGTADGGTNTGGWGQSVDLGRCSEGALTAPLTGLTADRLYYYRYFASNAYGRAWADSSASFRTMARTGPIYTWDAGGTARSPASWDDPVNWNGDAAFPNGVGQGALFTHRDLILDHQTFRLNRTITIGEVRFASTNAPNEPSKKYVDSFGVAGETMVFATVDGGEAEFRYESSGDTRMLCFQANMVLSNSLHYLNYQNRNGAGILGTISGPGGLRIERYRGATVDCDLNFGRAGDPRNTYEGGTWLSCGSTGNRAGTFNVKKNGAFGKGDITVNPYEIVVLENPGATDDMIADTATLYLQHTGTNYAKITLSAGVNETITTLRFDGARQRKGTWGSTSSAAMLRDDRWFSGTGVLTVLGTKETVILVY